MAAFGTPAMWSVPLPGLGGAGRGPCAGWAGSRGHPAEAEAARKQGLRGPGSNSERWEPASLDKPVSEGPRRRGLVAPMGGLVARERPESARCGVGGTPARRVRRYGRGFRGLGPGARGAKPRSHRKERPNGRPLSSGGGSGCCWCCRDSARAACACGTRHACLQTVQGLE